MAIGLFILSTPLGGLIQRARRSRTPPGSLDYRFVGEAATVTDDYGLVTSTPATTFANYGTV